MSWSDKLILLSLGLGIPAFIGAFGYMLYRSLKPPKTHHNKKLSWNCPVCEQSEALFISSVMYQEQLLFTIEESHKKLSPFCHTPLAEISVSLVDMTPAEVKAANAKSRVLAH